MGEVTLECMSDRSGNLIHDAGFRHSDSRCPKKCKENQSLKHPRLSRDPETSVGRKSRTFKQFMQSEFER